MILKKLQTGATTVIVTKKEYDEYISQGYTYVEDVEVEMDIDEAEEENIRFKLDGTNLYWKYESDFNWTLFAGGGGGASTSKVKVNASDSTEQYLSDKLVADIGTEISVVDTAGIKTLKFKSKANIPAYNVANAYKLGDIVEYTDSKEYRANADIPANTAWAIGTTGATWKLIGGNSGGSGITVYADLAAIKAVDTTSTSTYTDGVMVRVLTLGTFEFNRTSTAVGDDVNVIVPTTGGGKWLLVEGVRVLAPTSTNAQPWSEMYRTKYLFGDRAVKTLPATTMGKKIICLGSSVMFGLGLANPTTESYPALTLAEMAGWTIKNMSISGNTTAQVVARFHTDVIPENPDIIWIGLSPNNEGLDDATTDALAFSSLYNFEKGIETIVRLCEQNQVPYIISGLYPKGTYTATTYKYLKRFNIALQKKYGTRYINWLGTLDDGTGKFKSALVQADTVHPNAVGASNMFKCIPLGLFEFLKPTNRSGGYKKANGIVLGSDTTTAQPLAMYNSGTVRNNSFTIRTEFKGNVATDNVLIYVNGTNGTKLITVVKNASGNFEVRNNGVSIMTTTTAVPIIGYNTIALTFDKAINTFYLHLNGVRIGTSSVTTFFFVYFAIGGGDTPANNSVGIEFRNVAYWINNLTIDEIVADANGELLEGSLCLFNSLTTMPNGYFDNDGGAGTQYRFKINSTSWSLSNETDNNFTNAEKEKATAINAVGTAVASAATITVPANKTIFHVTGTVEISTINVPYAGFTGSIVIIPDGAFTFATSGNIAEAFTATINRAVEMVYDGVKWYRVGS